MGRARGPARRRPPVEAPRCTVRQLRPRSALYWTVATSRSPSASFARQRTVTAPAPPSRAPARGFSRRRRGALAERMRRTARSPPSRRTTTIAARAAGISPDSMVPPPSSSASGCHARGCEHLAAGGVAGLEDEGRPGVAGLGRAGSGRDAAEGERAVGPGDGGHAQHASGRRLASEVTGSEAGGRGRRGAAEVHDLPPPSGRRPRVAVTDARAVAHEVEPLVRPAVGAGIQDGEGAAAAARPEPRVEADALQQAPLVGRPAGAELLLSG